MQEKSTEFLNDDDEEAYQSINKFVDVIKCKMISI